MPSDSIRCSFTHHLHKFLDFSLHQIETRSSLYTFSLFFFLIPAALFSYFPTKMIGWVGSMFLYPAFYFMGWWGCNQVFPHMPFWLSNTGVIVLSSDLESWKANCSSRDPGGLNFIFQCGKSINGMNVEKVSISHFDSQHKNLRRFSKNILPRSTTRNFPIHFLIYCSS